MDEAQRARLIERRRMAQLRSARAAVSEKFRSVAPALRAAGVRAAKLVPARCRAALGPLTGGPGRDERLLWDKVPDATCRYWRDEAERDALVRAALACCAAPDTRVALVWHSFEAGLSIPAGDLAAHAASVIGAGDGGTTWIAAAEGGPWLIEVAYWDREVCWTRSMPLFVGG